VLVSSQWLTYYLVGALEGEVLQRYQKTAVDTPKQHGTSSTMQKY